MSSSHFFSKKFQHICVLLILNFNKLINNVVSFEQLGPGWVQIATSDVDQHYLKAFLSQYLG